MIFHVQDQRWTACFRVEIVYIGNSISKQYHISQILFYFRTEVIDNFVESMVNLVPVNPDEVEAGDVGLSSKDLDFGPDLEELAFRNIEGIVEEIE